MFAAEAPMNAAVLEDVAAPALQRFAPQPPVVVAERILRMQRYDDPTRVRPAIAEAARAMAAKAGALSRPQVAWAERPLARLDETGLRLTDGSHLRCEAFRTRLAGCTAIVPFVLTCGERFSELVVELAERGDLLEALLLETAGWLCIEDATQQFKEMLRARAAAKGRRITSRMGPGYSYRLHEAEPLEVSWPLEDQPALFALFGQAALPVRLLPSCAMFPKLSRSGLYGVAPLYGNPPPREPDSGSPEPAPGVPT
jgi:hypothetical protein